MNKMNYRIALQSRKILTDALFRLMEKEDYSLITVTQLCQEADLSRRTFYRLYESTENIINEYLGSLTEQFKCIVTEAAPRHYTEFAGIYFSFWERHADFLILLKRNGLLEILYKAAGEAALPIFQMVKPELHPDGEALKFALSYSLGGLNGMLIRWAEDGMNLSSAKMTEVLELTLKIAAI